MADAELLRRLEETTRQALDRLDRITASTSSLIAGMTKDAQSLQMEAMERTAAAAERLLRPQAATTNRPATDPGAKAKPRSRSRKR